MITQLREYILAELKRGASWGDIEKALYNAGHQKNVIDEAFSEIKEESAGLDAEEPDKPLEKDLVAGTKAAIGNFFSKLKTGKEVEEVKEEYAEESTDEIIDEAVNEAHQVEKTYIFEGYVFFLYLIILTFIILFTAGSTDDELILIVLGFSPTFLNAILSFTLVKYAKYAPMYIMIPVLASSGFYIVARFAGISLFSNMDYESLSIVNAILGMLFNVVLINIAFMRPEEKRKKIEQPQEKKHLKKVYEGKKELEKEKKEKFVSLDELPVQSNVTSSSINKFENHIDDLKKEFNLVK
jgi:hypothetical protein